MFFSFLQNKRKFQVRCSHHNPHGSLPLLIYVCAINTRGLKAKISQALEKHSQKEKRSGFPCINFKLLNFLMTAILMLRIILLSALPKGARGRVCG